MQSMNEPTRTPRLEWLFPFFLVAAAAVTVLGGSWLIATHVDSFRNCEQMCGGSEHVRRYSKQDGSYTDIVTCECVR